MMSFEAITANEYVTSERYYKLYKELFESPLYSDMRLDSKVAYSFLRDRLGLSLKNNWVDDEGSLYLVYSNPELMKILSCSKSTLLRIKKQLAEYGLIKEVQQSNSKKGTLANKIYLGSLVSVEAHSNTALSTPVSNSDEGGVKKTLGGCQNETGPVSNSATKETEYKETNNSYNIYSSRKAEEISDETPPLAEAPIPSSHQNYIPQKYYSLLEVIADTYNNRAFGFPECWTLQHKQKMQIGQYLASGFVFSDEIINIINKIPDNCQSPLAYLFTCLDNLTEERRLEERLKAHRQADTYFNGQREVV